MTHTYTALSQAGELLIDALTPEVNEQQIRAGQQMLNHYIRTGQRLARPDVARALKR
jgi:hypothetical protein